MADYEGRDNADAPIGPHIAGKGYWTTPTLPENEETRAAASAMVGAKAAIDRSVFLAHRFVNGVDGSPAGAPYPGDISWDGEHQFKNTAANTWFARGITVNSGASDFKAINVVGAADITGALDVGGPATLSDGLSLPVGSVTQVADAILHVGDDAYQGKRAVVVTAGNKTLQPWKNDYFASVTQGSAVTWTLDDPPAGANVEAAFIHTGVGSDIVLKRSNGTTILTLGVGQYKSASVAWVLTSYVVIASRA